MKIAITSQGKDLDANVDPRFGRCAAFIVIDPETLAFEVVDNTMVNATAGAGIQAGQKVADQNVEAVLTGNCGPKAFRTLQAAGIAIYSGVSGTIREAVEQFKAGALTADNAANVDGHFGSI